MDVADHNTFAVVISQTASQVVITAPGNPGSDASNTDAVIRQLPTNTSFTAAQIADAGYDTTEPVDVVVYQLSSKVDRGRPGFDSQGLDR